MLCAGATVYEPLIEYFDRAAAERKVGERVTGLKMGIVGLGGLGHLGVLFAKALGYGHVVAFSRSESKRADAMALGADKYVATSDEKDWAERYAASLDLIICTVSDPRMPLQAYLSLLRPRGHFCQVGIPEGPLPQLDMMALVLNGTSISFSDSASPKNTRDMLQLAADNAIKAVRHFSDSSFPNLCYHWSSKTYLRSMIMGDCSRILPGYDLLLHFLV